MAEEFRFFLTARWMCVKPWELVDRWEWFERGEFYRELYEELQSAKVTEVK